MAGLVRMYVCRHAVSVVLCLLCCARSKWYTYYVLSTALHATHVCTQFPIPRCRARLSPNAV